MSFINSLHQWIKSSFTLNGPCDSPEDLCDGVSIAQALQQISPEYFDNDWLGKIRFDAGTNWRLKLSNLSKIKQRISDFYLDVINQQINDKFIPDINAIAKDSNLDQLGILLQLILYCAIKCERQDIFIQAMLNLDEKLQLDLMAAIQQVKNDSGEDSSETMNQEFELNRKLEEALRDKDMISQKCHELEIKISKLEEEKYCLLQENDRLRQTTTEPVSSHGTQSIVSIQEEAFQRLQHKIENLQDDLFKMEEAKEEYRISSEKLQEEIVNLRNLNDHLKQKMPNYDIMKDELESLRYALGELERVKAINEAQRKKIEEGQDFRRQLRLSEEKHTSLMKRNIELEEEIKKLNSLKTQIENYKKQINELRGKIAEETWRADKLQHENTKTNEKYIILLREKETLANEVSSLKVSAKKFNKDYNVYERISSIDDSSMNLLDNHLTTKFLQDSSDSNINEKLVQLESENEILKKKIKDSESEKVKFLESQLQDEKERVSELESRNRLINQKLIEYEDKIKDMQYNVTNVKVPNSDVKSIDHLKLEEIIQHKESVIESIKSELHDSEQEALNLKSILAKKEEELAETESRYKKYLEKAKEVIETLEPLSIPISEESSHLKQQLQHSQRQYLELKNEFEKSKALNEMEQRLMTIAFHNLSASLQRKSAEERIRNNSSNQSSLLTRQRQATTRRFNVPGVTSRLEPTKLLKVPKKKI